MTTQIDTLSDDYCRALYQRFCQGDRRASIELVNLFGNRLLQYVSRTCIYDDPEAAADCVQNTWIKLLQNCGKPLKEGSFWGLLCAIARHQAIDDYRAKSCQKRQPVEAMESLEDYHQSTWLDESVNPAQWIEDMEDQRHNEQKQRDFQKAMASLPLKQRQALTLWLADYSLKTIAVQMGEKEETVKSHLRYAKDKLKRLMLASQPNYGLSHDS